MARVKSTGIVRKLDRLGRLVIPKELRFMYDLKEGTPMEIFIQGDLLILRKYEPGCIFCGSMEKSGTYKDKVVCLDCAEILKDGVTKARKKEVDKNE